VVYHFFIIVSFLGFLDATYLTIEHYRGNIPPCTIAGCEIVLTSGYAKIVGIPVALLGSLYYLTILILSVAYLDLKKIAIIRFASYCTIAGFAASLYFVYLMLFVIKEICQYCLISATTSTILFILGLFIITKSSRSKAIFQNTNNQ
jgi:uncharacterized membrane protein